MSGAKEAFNQGTLTIGYRKLGTISIDELAHAIFEDIQCLKDLYKITFIQGGHLRICATNEYGEPVRLQRPEGGSVKYIDTLHYRPACRDYKL